MTEMDCPIILRKKNLDFALKSESASQQSGWTVNSIIAQLILLKMNLLKNTKSQPANRGFTLRFGYSFFVFFPIELLLPATIILYLMLFVFQLTDPGESTVAMKAIGIVVHAWRWTVIINVIIFIFGWYKEIVLRISGEGISFSEKKFFYEYEWDEVDYIYEKYVPLHSPRLCIKVLEKNEPFVINLDGYMFTFYIIRFAIKRYAKDRAVYITNREWKRRHETK